MFRILVTGKTASNGGRRRRCAFTLIELLVVIAIIAVLIGLLLKVTIGETLAEMRRRTMPVPTDAPMQRNPKPASASPVSLPAKYKDVNTSGLVFTLIAGQPLEIELQ